MDKQKVTTEKYPYTRNNHTSNNQYNNNKSTDTNNKYNDTQSDKKHTTGIVLTNKNSFP